MILFMGLFYGWFWALGTNLHPKLPETVKMNLTKFKFSLLFPLVYMAALLFFISGFLWMGLDQGPKGIEIALLIFPLHIFSMFCMIYCLYFISKELKSVEWQRPVTFGDYAGEFFLIWFYPVGIWILQPRINKLFDDRLSDSIEIVSNIMQ
jgi:hypothetical protein